MTCMRTADVGVVREVFVAAINMAGSWDNFKKYGWELLADQSGVSRNTATMHCGDKSEARSKTWV